MKLNRYKNRGNMSAEEWAMLAEQVIDSYHTKNKELRRLLQEAYPYVPRKRGEGNRLAARIKDEMGEGGKP